MICQNSTCFWGAVFFVWGLFLGLTVWGDKIVVWIRQKRTTRQSQEQSQSSTRPNNQAKKVVRALVMMLCVSGCTKTTPSKIEYVCTPIYGTANDWKIISKELTKSIYENNKTCKELQNA